MNLVHHHMSHSRDGGVVQQPPQQHPGGAEQEAGAGGGLMVQTDGVTHGISHLRLKAGGGGSNRTVGTKLKIMRISCITVPRGGN